MNLKKWVVSGVIAFILYMLFLRLTDAGFIANFIAYISLFVIAGQGWNLLGGYIGEISFGHAVFFGIGAYTVGLPVGYKLDINLLLLVLLGALMAGIFALIISYPLLRVQGFPFLVGTYGLGVVIRSIVVVTPALFATRGIFISTYSKNFTYPLIIGFAIAVVIFVQWLVNQDLGLRFKAVRDVPTAARMIGINIYKTKASAFVIGAMLTGLAGGLFALYGGFVNPSACFGDNTSIFILLGPYIGGIGSVLGALFGSTIVIILQEVARSVITVNGGHYLMVGALLVVVMMLSKEGIYPGIVKLVKKIKNAYQKRQGE